MFLHLKPNNFWSIFSWMDELAGNLICLLFVTIAKYMFKDGRFFTDHC